MDIVTRDAMILSQTLSFIKRYHVIPTYIHVPHRRNKFEKVSLSNIVITLEKWHRSKSRLIIKRDGRIRAKPKCANYILVEQLTQAIGNVKGELNEECTYSPQLN